MKKKTLTITNTYLEKSRGGCILRYLISQHGSFTWLCLIPLIIKINFLFNQMIVEIDTHKIDCIKLKKKNISCKVALIKNIIKK